MKKEKKKIFYTVLLKKIKLLPLCLSFIIGSLYPNEYFIYKTKINEDVSSIAKKFEIEPIDIISINPEVLSSTQTFNKSKKLIIWKKNDLLMCPESGDALHSVSFNAAGEITTNQLLNNCYSKLKKRIDLDLFNNLNVKKFDFEKFLANENNIDYLYYDLATKDCDPPPNKFACGLEGWKYKELYIELHKMGVPEIVANEEYFDFYESIGARFDDGRAGAIFADVDTNKLFVKMINEYLFSKTGGESYGFITQSDITYLASKDGILEVLNMPQILKGILIGSIFEFSSSSLTDDSLDLVMTYIGEMEIKQRNRKDYASPDDMFKAIVGMFVFNNSGNEEAARRIYDSVSNMICNKCFSPLLANNTDFKWSQRLMVFYGNHLVSLDAYEKIDLYPEIIDLEYSPGWLKEDYAASLIHNQRCDLAYQLYFELSKQWRKSFNENGYWDDTSPITEPVDMALCYWSSYEESASEMLYFLEYSLEVIEDFSARQSLVEIFDIYKKLIQSIKFQLSNEISLSDQLFLEGYNDLVSFDLARAKDDSSFILQLYELVLFLESIKKTNKIDFIKLKNATSTESSDKKIKELKVAKENVILKNLKSKFTNVSAEIQVMENQLTDLDEKKVKSLFEKYELKKKITNDILELSRNLTALLTESVKSQKDVIESLGDDEYVLMFEVFDNNSYAFVFSKNKVDLVPLQKGRSWLNEKKTKLLTSIGQSFDFQSSNQLYVTLFQPLENFLTKNSDVFILRSEEVNFPLNILLKNIPASSNYTSNLISSQWLIRDYTFAKYLPVSKPGMSTDYDTSFLGIANASSYDAFGLPDLSEAEKEILNLAITTNAKKENILVGSLATKENFLEKMTTMSVDKIVISAHAVPRGWRGQINETALLLKSSGDDPFLTSSEVAQLDIGTSMVVLSACNEDSEGFLPLYKSFLIAGADSIVHSSWKLESRYANEFTEEFFKELWLSEDLNKHRAMRSVALRFLDNYANETYIDPAFWGNFTIAYSKL